MKTLLSLLFLFTALSCAAQYHNVEGIRVVGRSDSTTISNVGQIQFDADDDKFRFNDGTGWFSFLKDSDADFWPLSGSADITTENIISSQDDFRLLAENDGLFTFGSIIIGTSGDGETPEHYITFDSNGATVTGDVITYAADYSPSSDREIPDVGYVNSHLAGVSIPLGSTATSGQIIRRGSLGWEFDDYTPTTSGSGITVTDGAVNLGGSNNVTGDIDLTWDNTTGTNPAVTWGRNGVPYDSMAFFTRKKGFTFYSDTINRVAQLIISADSGMVYYAGDDVINQQLIRWAADYTGHNTFTDLALTPKLYVDGRFDGIQVPEGTNKTMGIATLSSGTVTVNTTAVTANSRIFLTINGGTLTNVGTPYVSSRTSTSFTITSTNASDASDVAWIIINPAP